MKKKKIKKKDENGNDLQAHICGKDVNGDAELANPILCVTCKDCFDCLLICLPFHYRLRALPPNLPRPRHWTGSLNTP